MDHTDIRIIKLKSWLGKKFKIKISDGRVLIGTLICTDKDQNIILSCCVEHLIRKDGEDESRLLGLAMIPGHHILSIHVDEKSQDNKIFDKMAAEHAHMEDS